MRNEEWFQRIDAAIAHLHELIHADLTSDEGTAKTVKHLEKAINKVIAQGDVLMSKISDFADKMKVHNDHMDEAVAGLQGDVKNLSDQIAALQASAGQITPEDQALLDGIEAKAADIHAKLDALDALTPPVVPPSP